MEHIGRYRTERVLGSGAFATVWLARDDRLDAQVAVKLLAENWAHDADVRRRFEEEARILWRADSPHIVRVHTVDELDDGRPYFVMDYADRGDLAARLPGPGQVGTGLPIDDSIGIALDIADGLSVAHSLGIVHRDLKPSNVMYQSIADHHDDERNERLVLVDFGVARSLAGARDTTIAAGTPHYMAPEQAERQADERSDIYSAAVILYQCLSGDVPYPQESLSQLIRAQIAGPPPHLSTVRPGIPSGLADIVAAGLSIDPAGRPPTVQAWATALRAIAQGSSTSGLAATVGPEAFTAGAAAGAAAAAAGAPGAGSHAAGSAGGPPPPTAPPPGGGSAGGPTGATPAGSEPSGGRRRGLVPLAVGLAALAALIVGAIVVSGDDEGDGETAGEIFAEPIASVGQDPFMGSLVPDADELAGTSPELAGLVPPVGELPDLRLPSLDLPSPGAAGATLASVGGSAPGLYGGTNELALCDPRQLVDFLAANADKAAAWASVIGIQPGQIPSFVDGLTDVILQTDTRVTNHGFSGGRANPLQSVLQAGTAVLVDGFGIPVVRCFCGNPLSAPQAAANPTIAPGPTWPGFSLPETVVIQVLETVDEFVLDDVLSTATLFRRPGTPATSATFEPGGSTTTTTSAPQPATTTTAPPPPPTTTTAPPRVPINVTGQGSVSTSSVYSGEFSSGLAADGSRSTSWFSGGSNTDGSSSTLTWSPNGGGTLAFQDVIVLSNAAHSNPSFRSGFGFDSVVVQLLRGGEVVDEQSISLPGTPDPDVSAKFNGSEADTVQLIFSGHEDPTCGGISELQVWALE